MLRNGFSISAQETLTVRRNKLGIARRAFALSALKSVLSSGKVTEILSSFTPTPNNGVVTIFALSKLRLSFACSFTSFCNSGLY